MGIAVKARSFMLAALVAGMVCLGGSHVAAADKDLAAPRGIAVHNVKVLHHHQRVGAHPLGHVDGDYTVADVAAVRRGNNRRGYVHLSHALLHLKCLLRLIGGIQQELAALLNGKFC